MKHEDIREFVRSQRSRDPRPMNAFVSSMLSLTNASKELDGIEMSASSKTLLKHLIVIHVVTVLECYFRDSIDAIFRLCEHGAFVPALNKLAKQKYSIQEIVELEAAGLHILQVIPREMSFQSLEQISGAFDNFISAGFVKEVGKHQFRFKDLQSQIMEVSAKTLADLATLFSTRHELVHNPDEKVLRANPPDLECCIETVWNFVFCANAVIENFIGDNLKESVALTVTKRPV